MNKQINLNQRLRVRNEYRTEPVFHKLCPIKKRFNIMSSYHTLDVHTIGNILDRSDDAINQTGEHKLSIFAASNDVSPETPQSAEVVFHICSAINRSTHERDR